MKEHLRFTSGLIGFFLLVAGSALAQQSQPNEITVFGGVSILDASGSSEWVFGDGSIPVSPDFPTFPDFPGSFPGIAVRSKSSLGSSALFGARYSRRIKDRLALEADLAIAPTHDLELGGEVCFDGFGCFGEGRGIGERFGREWAGRFDRNFAERGITAWHYGGGLAYDLTEGDVRPLLFVGAGGVSWDGASKTDFVFRFGGGLKVLFGKVGARVDVVDHLVLDHFLSNDNEHDVHATAGFLVNF